MSQRLSSSARGSAAADYVSVIDASSSSSPALASPSKVSWSPFTSCMQVLRGEKPIDHVALVLQSSLCTNICIVLVMTSVAIASKSLALLSTLVENMVDLFVQGLLWYAGTRGGGKKQDYAKYPAGTSRFEPVAIIVAASVMVLVSVTFIQEGVSKLIDGFVHGKAEAPNLSTTAIILSSTIVVIKIGLVFYSYWTIKRTYSAAAHAIGDDNRNDVASNSLAIAAYIISSSNPDLWYVDACGAIFIFLLIMVAWAKMGKEQVAQLVGVSASEEFMTQVKTLSATHHHAMSLDIMRAYHFGSKYLVELEVVVPAEMTVKMAHDIALQLQFKVENLEDVERAFVHVDYKTRDYDEHVVSREEDALLTYAGYEAVPLKSGDSSYVAVPIDELDFEVDDDEVVPVPVVTTPLAGGHHHADGLTTDFHELKE